MIRVINGKRYNTEAAQLVYEYTNGHYLSDFRFRRKDLYRTKSGAWFIHHRGGACTDMAVGIGNGATTGSETIEAVSDDDAYGFLEAHSDDSDALAAIDKYFAARVVDA